MRGTTASWNRPRATTANPLPYRRTSNELPQSSNIQSSLRYAETQQVPQKVKPVPHIRLLNILLVTLFIVTEVLAQTKVPQFKSYPATEVFTGKNAPLILSKEDARFRTRLREAAKQKPNFAGHFVLMTFGCGTSCVMGSAIDVKTGKVYWFPHTTCCWGDVDEKFRAIEYRLESKLIIFSGLRNEKNGDDGAHFYKFDNGEFVYIKSISVH